MFWSLSCFPTNYFLLPYPTVHPYVPTSLSQLAECGRLERGARRGARWDKEEIPFRVVAVYDHPNAGSGDEESDPCRLPVSCFLGGRVA